MFLYIFESIDVSLPYFLSFKVYINAGKKHINEIKHLTELTFITKVDIEFNAFLKVTKSTFLSVLLSEEEKHSIIEEINKMFLFPQRHETLNVLYVK